ncbi:hypothetical protein BT69DRAFT_1344278 [Atractiella rhizophila]|nr:hypothetical protein BT69DRAFT_1344278 [Atractiella rhizophila]
MPPLSISTIPQPEDTYIPGLTSSSLFHRDPSGSSSLPSTDPLTSILQRHVAPGQIPQRDLSGSSNGLPLERLIAENRWRAVAEYAREKIVDSDATHTTEILEWWHLRLLSLLRLRLSAHLLSEASSLQALLPPLDTISLTLCFPLLVFFARLPALKNSPPDAISNLSVLIRRCAALEGTDPIWEERGTRLVFEVVGLLIQMRDYPSASSLLSSLPPTAPTLLSLLRLSITTGNLNRATSILDQIENLRVSSSPSLETLGGDGEEEKELKRTKLVARGLLHAARAEWTESEGCWRECLTLDPTDYVAANNLSVTHLFHGRLSSTSNILHTILDRSPSSFLSTEALLFNLATTYELTSEAEAAGRRKAELARRVAGYGGEGLKTGCLKLG